MQQPPSRQSDNSSTIEINVPSTVNLPRKKNVVILEAANTPCALNLILTTQRYTDIDL